MGKTVDIRVSLTLRENVASLFNILGIRAPIMIEDIQEVIDEETKDLNPLAFDYNNYNNMSAVSKYRPLSTWDQLA